MSAPTVVFLVWYGAPDGSTADMEGVYAQQSDAAARAAEITAESTSGDTIAWVQKALVQ